jgi:hypothetical protein
VDQKSTYDCCFTLGSHMVSWYNKKQIFVVLSSTDVEYISLSVSVREGASL